MSNNYHFDISSEDREQFDRAMAFAFDGRYSEMKARGYRLDPEKGLILYWSIDSNGAAAKGVQSFPYEMKVKAATEFAWHWLQEQNYGAEPDHDGSNHKGWRVYNESWNRIGSEWGAFVAIKPEWMMYGK